MLEVKNMCTGYFAKSEDMYNQSKGRVDDIQKAFDQFQSKYVVPAA
jgi:hypothetical protein